MNARMVSDKMQNMKGFLTLISVLWLCHAVCAKYGKPEQKVKEWVKQHSNDPDARKVNKAMGYLSEYGYSDPDDDIDFDKFEKSVRKMQHMFGILETGEIDALTERTMRKPRCGRKDVDVHKVKRAVLNGWSWMERYISYRVTKYSTKMADADVDWVIEKAFAAWSNVSSLIFVKSLCQDVDIEIRFEEFEHGDVSAFDGPVSAKGYVLAHAFPPYPSVSTFSGDIHVDDSETWRKTIEECDPADPYQFSLLAVVRHEIGHAIGLDHSSDVHALMYPAYKPQDQLGDDDITGIQGVYGDECKPHGILDTCDPIDGSLIGFPELPSDCPVVTK